MDVTMTTMEVPTNSKPTRLRRRLLQNSMEWSVASHQSLRLHPQPEGQRQRANSVVSKSFRVIARYPPPPPPPLPLPPVVPHSLVNFTKANTTIDNSNTSESYATFYDTSFYPWYDSGTSRFHRRINVSSSGTASFHLVTYVQFLCWLLMAWSAYLLLPKGLRKAYCRADRRRHKRHRQVALLPNQQTALATAAAAAQAVTSRSISPPLDISVPRIHLDSSSKSVEPPKQLLFRNQHQSHHEPHQDEYSQSLASLLDDSSYSASASQDSITRTGRYHPAIPVDPSLKILRDTFARLEHSGIRLMAHGIQCESKRVWIRVVKDRSQQSYQIKWQTEVCQTVTSSDGRVSRVWVKRGGAGHTLPLVNVLCVDVGKNTSALARKTDLEPNTCFSLLTPTGSLDLQARSQLERDAIVCCFARLLDEVHDVDWRQLYQESPEPSIVTSAVQSTMQPSTVNTNAAVAYADSSVDSSFF